MKSFKEYNKALSEIETIALDEEVDGGSASTQTSGVDNPDAKPVFKKSKFMGYPVIEVDDDTYCNCIKGKVPFSRWSKFIEDDNLRDEMREMFKKNQKVLMSNSVGAMAYVKAGKLR